MLGDPRRALRMMAAPMLISLLVAQLNTFVDTFWCAGLGAVPLAAVGMVASIYLILAGIGNGVGVGVSASLAAKVARRDKPAADAVAAQALVFMVLIGLLCIPIFLVIGNPILLAAGGSEMYPDCRAYALPFYLGAALIVIQGVAAGILRGEGAARKAMAVLITAAVFNIVFDPLFTFIFNWGIAGLAWATIAATALSLLPFVYWYFIAPTHTYLDIRLRDFRFSRPLLRDFLSIGVPKAVELDIMAVVNFVLNFFVVSCGGAVGYAVYVTSWRFTDLMLVPSQAIAGALVPICAAAFGRFDFSKMRTAYGIAMKWSLVIAAVLAMFIFLAAPWLMIMFTYTGTAADLREPLVHTTRIFLLIGVMYSAVNISSSLLQALRMAKNSMWSTLIRNLLLIVVFAITSLYSLDAMWWGFVVCEIIGLVLMVGWAEAGYRKRRAESGRAGSS